MASAAPSQQQQQQQPQASIVELPGAADAKATRPALDRSITTSAAPLPAAPATSPPMGTNPSEMILELADGTAYRGISFGAEDKSISGECVFQTGE